MKENFGKWMAFPLLLLMTTGWACGEPPRRTIRISVAADGGFHMDGAAANGKEVRDVLKKLSPETDVVQLYGESGVPNPYAAANELLLIYHRGLTTQFAFKPDFSDITAATPAMRIHVDPDGTGFPRIDFTGCVSVVCAIHHEKMAIIKVGTNKEPGTSFIPILNKEQRDAQYPLRGVAVAGVFFMEMAEVYQCPTCSREFEAMVKKAIETPQTVGGWTTYVSLRGVPEALRKAFMAQVPDGSAGRRVGDCGWGGKLCL